MGRRGLIGASALALMAAVGSDSGQSFTIPTTCTDPALCASICRSAIEEGRTEQDFIQLAAWQLGPANGVSSLPAGNLNMPAPVDPKNVYAGAGAGMFSPAVEGHLHRVYAPNLITGKVDVIDPDTFKVIDSLATATSPEHIVPSWDLQTLWVSGDLGLGRGRAAVAPIDPKTGKLGRATSVPDSYNMYFTPDGRSAILVAEAMRRLEFRDPRTMDLQGYINTPNCAGINHADFAPDGSYAIFTCEFNNALAKIDLVQHRLAQTLPLSPGHMPQDIKVAPDGSAFFVADLLKDGLVVIDGNSLKETGFIPTGIRRARPLSEPRWDEALCHEPRHPQYRGRQEGAGLGLGVRLRDPQGRGQLDRPRRRQPGHGKFERRRQIAVAVRPLRRRDLRLQHRRRRREDHPGRRYAPRPHRLAPARPIFAGAYGEFAVGPPRL